MVPITYNNLKQQIKGRSRRGTGYFANDHGQTDPWPLFVSVGGDLCSLRI